MTDNFKFIYKILKTLESAMDCSEFDLSQISAERLSDETGRIKMKVKRYLPNES